MIGILSLISHKKNHINGLSLKQELKISNIINTFILMSESEILSFFKNLISLKHSCQIKENYIEIPSDNSNLIIVCPMFCANDICENDIINIYKKIKTNKIKRLIILTNTFNAQILNITSYFNFETLILDGKKTYFEFVEKYNYYPQETPKQQKSKSTLKQFLSIAFNKKRAKGYLLSAIFLFFSSLFVKFKIYYCMFSSILVIFALISYFNPKFNKKPNVNYLD